MSKSLIAAAALALFAAPALAQTDSVAVRASGVNFNDPAQVQAIYAQINDAARRACTTPSDNRYVAAPDKECVDRAVAQAVRQTNKPLLTAAFDAGSAQGSSNRALAGNDQ